MPIRTPHETEPARWTATAWPSDPHWGDGLAAAREGVSGFVRALAGDGNAGRKVGVLALPELAEAASEALAEIETARVFSTVVGDIWLRDTGPVFTLTPEGARAVQFRFNGWGGKFPYADDQQVAPFLAKLAEFPLDPVDLVCEGGALEVDGQGTLVTTREVLRNANRNPGRTEAEIERVLGEALGAERVIWLDEGLAGDHTDGHVDNLARFARPGLVVCQAPAGPDDPNAAVLDDVARTLDRARDADGRRIDVARIPSPGRVTNAEGALLPASHMNFVFREGAVLMPSFETPSVMAALAGLKEVFPDREIIPVDARGLIAEGGGLHCASIAAPAEGAVA